MSKLDTNHVVNLDLVKDRVNSIIKFGLADVETSDFYLGLYNNGSRVFDKDYIVTVYIVKPNGTFRNIKLEPKEGLKKYYCNLPDTLKNIPGEYVCQVMVFDNLTNEKKISKSKFKYSVDLDLASEMAGIIDEEEQESILTNILNRLLTLENPVEPYATQKHVDECVSTLTEEIDTIKVKDTEQDGRLNAVETKNNEQDNRLDIIESKDIEQDNRLVNIESKDIEQDNRLNIIESKDIEQDERLNTLKNKVDGIDEKIVDTIEPTLVNHGNRVDALENKDLVHELRMTDIESKNVEQDNRLTSIEGINTTQDNRLDALEAKDIAHESRMTNIEAKNTEHDNRLNSLESKDLGHESRLTNIESKNTEQDEKLNNVESKNVEQDNRLDIAENRLANIGNDITNTMQPIIDEYTSRLDAIEAIDVAQNNRLDAIEAKNTEQDDRLLDIEKVNNKQDIDIKCLYGASQTIDVTKEGNSIYLQNSNNGFTIVDEIQGNTLVNCNKEPDKELILNGNINASGDNAVTITEGVDGGLVDVALEGNTLVNVSKTKDSTAITKAYTVENSGNHIALQGDVDDNCRPVITGNTLVNIATCSKNTYDYLTHEGSWVVFNADGNSTYRIDPVYPRNELIKADTTYTVIIDISQNTLNSTVEINWSGLNGVENGTCMNLDIYAEPGVTGRYVYVGKSKSDIINQKYIIVPRLIPSNTSGLLKFRISILEGDYTNKPIPDYFEGLQSTFEDNLVTQEMIDNGEEVADNLGKYKVEYKSTQEDGTVGNTKTLYLNSPLLEGDTIEEKDGGIYHVHRSELTAYTEGDEASLITDKVNTLHQLASPTYELIEQSNLVIPSYTNGHLDFNTAVPVEKVEFLPFSEKLTYLYANTQYTIQFISTRAILADITLGGTSLLAQNIVEGLNRITITTPSELVNNKLVISGVGANISKVVVSDTDREFRYFEGMKSVGECEELEVKSNNKNLWNWDDIYNQYGTTNPNVYKKFNGTLTKINDNEYSITPYHGGWYEQGVFSTPVYLKKGESLTFSGECSHFANICIYNLSNFLSPCSSVINNPDETLDDFIRLAVSCTAQEDGYYVCRFWIRDNQTAICRNIQVEKSSQATDYIPHQSNTQQLTHKPLRSVGEVKDIYVMIDGKWYIERKCGVRAYQEGDKDNYKTDLINTVYPLETPAYEEINYNPLEVYSNITHITTNSTIPPNIIVKNHGFNCLLKPSTTYTISSNLGLNTVTTPSTLTEDCLRFYDTDTSDVTTMRDVLVLEGDWTSKADLIPANFSGMESAFEQEYDAEKGKYKVNAKVVGKNLFNKDNIIIGKYHNCNMKTQNFTISNNSNCSISKLIPIRPNTTYITQGLSGKYHVYYDINKKVITNVITNNNRFTTPNNAYYIVLNIDNNKDNLSNIQIEQGDTATEYEPYKENNITFYINEPLRGVGNVKDKVFIKDDKVVVQRNCGSTTFDGSADEDIKNYGFEGGNSQTNTLGFSILEPKAKIKYDLENFYCDKFKFVKGIWSKTQDYQGINANNLSQFLFRINKSELQTQDIVGFKQWLQQNPVTVVYQLAEPTYEEVEYNDTKLFIESFKNSTLFYNSNVPVTSKLYYSYSVPIVDTVAQTANISDQQDSMIIDMATQVAVMEIMLM